MTLCLLPLALAACSSPTLPAGTTEYYRRAIDFDGDGHKEQFLLALTERTYVCEVRSGSRGNRLVHRGQERSLYRLRETKAIRLSTGQEQTYLVKSVWAYGLAGVDGVAIHAFWGLVEGKWRLKETLTMRYHYQESTGPSNVYHRQGNYSFTQTVNERELPVDHNTYEARLLHLGEPSAEAIIRFGAEGASTISWAVTPRRLGQAD